MVAVNDLGAGGVIFNSSNNLEIGTILNFKIGFSTTTPSINCDGIVTKRHWDISRLLSIYFL